MLLWFTKKRPEINLYDRVIEESSVTIKGGKSTLENSIFLMEWLQPPESASTLPGNLHYNPSLLTQYSPHISSLCANLLLVTWCLFSLTHTISPLLSLKSLSCFRTGENWPMEVCRGYPWWPLHQVGSPNSFHTKCLSGRICLISQTTMRHIFHSHFSPLFSSTRASSRS